MTRTIIPARRAVSACHRPTSAFDRVRGSQASRPPHVVADPTLASVFQALGHCTHPGEGTTSAEIVESDGARATITWCGVCGAIRVCSARPDDWIRPGLGMALEMDRRLSALASSLRVFMAQLGELTTTAHEVCAAPVDAAERGRSELYATIVALDNAGAELARHARDVLGELGA